MAGKGFDRTWWGKSWITALEGAGEGYENRLPRGRSYARRGAVRDLTLAKGHVAARVVGRHGELHQVDIAVRTLAESEWDQVAEAIASRSGHLAALLDGEIHPDVLADVERLDVRLLPTAIDLRPDCDCPDWAEPCKHAAAVCYVTATELDRDPFSLFLLRGMTRSDLMTLVRQHRGGPSSTDNDRPIDSEPPGVDAASAWSGRNPDDQLEVVPTAVTLNKLSDRAEQRPRRAPSEAEIPTRFGIDVQQIEDLASDAVVRAWGVIVRGSRPMLGLNARADLARRASLTEWPAEVARLAGLGGITTQQLSAWIEAWRIASDAGVAVVADHSTWQTDQSALGEGREQLVAAGCDRRAIALNYDSLRMADSVLLVLGCDAHWYKLHGTGRHQDLRLAREPSLDITELVDLA